MRRSRRKELDLDTAQRVLEKGLSKYGHVIRTLRSYYQHLQAFKPDIDSDTLSWENWERLMDLERRVDENAGGSLHIGRAGLFTVPTDDFTTFLNSHDAWRGYRDLGLGIDFVAGFWCMFYIKNYEAIYECMFLDDGRSTRVFEELGDRRRELVEEFTRRDTKEGPIYIDLPKNLPTVYCTVITEQDLGEYDIKMILPFKISSSYQFHRVFVPSHKV